ncbi:PA2169 family four-helix-bundle protein [Arenimonas oryziterrae]|uniref:DUF2383 domain-containing protein n=1 Tax=Arenimonas oryziterrae DSM 21050 = YC6267 TaxID=1121015 RepID=A0A091AX69_9GAMM|nr:PA2169 family four-helix-bundle protein [Arenimonas oryziterrae]KFN43877.1 hypothetical protein N789_07985 [Arenimonas oryziterrae DSM 21050 = YC6267]
MTRISHSLIDLVHALNDGIAFYDQASRKSENPHHADVFFRMRHIKSAIAADLNAEIAIEGEAPHLDGSWIGALRHGYAELQSKLANDTNQAWLDQIESQEDRILDAFRLASASDPSDRVRELAKLYLPDVQRMHDEISALTHHSLSELPAS